ncbi:hypothetical protein [Variovorax sp. PMC12]|uniref:hypothetical protein n=1 Tax=Variovorax sp. PMC12 TaxID=2126319 RepID=UPI000D123CDD|nr:hypothetical protein [Variovorax sp. PMC12]AVQ81655.1 hypothetical protein C4F17_12235 [Variovorax sp. PMC12]
MKLYAPTDEAVSIGLTSGHMLVIERAGTEVPLMFRREAISRGCLTSPDEIVDDEQKPEFDRKKVIADAIRAMLDGDNEGDFKNDGTPDLRALQKRVGFQVQRDEADAIFKEVSEEAAGA